MDGLTKLAKGFDYRVAGAGSWRDARGSAWVGREMGIEISCPKDFQSRVFYHFHDWNDKGRGAHLYFEGRDMGPTGEHAGEGLWFSQPVTPQLWGQSFKV